MKALRLPPLILAVTLAVGGESMGGPYSAEMNDPTNLNDAPVPGFVGPDGDGGAPVTNTSNVPVNQRNYLNPIFFDWAASVTDYSPAPNVNSTYANPSVALGPVTGLYTSVVSLGDLSSSQLSSGLQPGSLTLYFANPIWNLDGADFAVFENAFAATAGRIFSDLAYVEASSDGINFYRFPSSSLTTSAVGPYGTIDPTNVFNLAGKHVNANGNSWGTPFDLSAVGLSSVSYIRIVDIPGSGTFLDSFSRKIYDPWLTMGSGGADIEAVGTISRLITFDQWQDLRGLSGGSRGAAADDDGDAVGNFLEYAFSRDPVHAETSPLTTAAIESDRLVLTFNRDERASDLIYEVQVSDTLNPNDWTTLAQSTGGQAVAGVNGFSPTITESSASAIASVGVIRKVRVTDVENASSHARRFMRVKVSKISGT